MPPEITTALILLTAGIIAAIGLWFKARTNVVVARMNVQAATLNAQAETTKSNSQQATLFIQMVEDLRKDNDKLEAKYDRLDEDYRKEVQRGNAQEEIIRDLHKQVTELPFLREKVDILQKQIEGIQESRAQRELELKEANERATTAEARVTALEGERDSLNARIVELENEVQGLNERLKGVEQDIRATPVQEIPAVLSEGSDA